MNYDHIARQALERYNLSGAEIGAKRSGTAA